MTPISRLPEMDHLLTAHITFRVPDDSTEPLLRPGDFGVIDTQQRTPEDGGVFLVSWRPGHRSLLETNPFRNGGELAWAIGVWNRPRSKEDVDQWLAQRRILPASDAPYSTAKLEQHIMGRLVGRLVGATAIAEACQTEALTGAEDDLRARAAAASFDPARYTELFDKTGMVGYVQRSAKGETISFKIVRDETTVSSEEKRNIYEEHAAVFNALRDGEEYANAMLRDYLRSKHRVITYADGRWRFDPKMNRRLAEKLRSDS